ncbi:MAG: signal peptidase II [Candidatus Neomarinimicrobiota bacterium]|nr:signal peptidase II [Candidatus Neomarinimicrobiota bacterium]
MKLLIVNAVIVAIDQLTKAVVRNSMFIGESKPIINNFFHLTYITNDGMAFGLDFPGGSFLFNFVSISLTIFLAWYYWQERNSNILLRISLLCILAGAIGNLIDRIIFGTVVDFLDFMIGGYHWYVFNIADSSVTVGMCLYILFSVKYQSKDKPLINTE